MPSRSHSSRNSKHGSPGKVVKARAKHKTATKRSDFIVTPKELPTLLKVAETRTRPMKTILLVKA
jgi:hypothetical protein